MKNIIIIIIILAISSFSTYAAEPLLDKLEFDNSKYIDVSELHRGMEGYGLTVFEGTKIEKFKVRIVSVMTAKTIGRSAFLVMVEDNKIFDVARGVHGCSGSPVYFNGKMAGAMSFGWDFQEEPIYGVTPIKQMLNTYKRVLASENNKKNASTQVKLLDREVYTRLMSPEILTVDDLRKMTARMNPTAQSLIAGAKPLPLNISVSGLEQGTLTDMSQSMPGLSINTSSFTGSLENELKNGRPKLEPGSTITIPLVSGDMEACTLGTVTEVIDDWVFAFGHSFNGNGPCNWPMATGYIHSFISGKQSSFKLGQAIDVVGAVEADEVVAICGRVGQKAPTSPAHTVVHYEGLGETIEFNLNLVQDDMYTPAVASIATIGPAQYRGAMPDHCTVKYNVALDFGKFGLININDVSSDFATSELRMDVMQAVSLMISSPWDDVRLEKMDAEITVSDVTTIVDIDRVSLGKLVYKPGETITADVTCVKYRDNDVKLQSTLKLPDDIKPGKYNLTIGGKRVYLIQNEIAKPYIGFASCTSDIVKIMEVRNKYKRDNIFMTIINPKPELALEEEPLDRIPDSKAMLLVSNARHTPVMEYNNMIESATPCDFIIYGQARFQIEVEED